MEATAVLDIGKTNVKLCVVDGEGHIVFSLRRPNRTLPGPPYPHYDVDGIWSWLLDALRQAGERARIGAIVTAAHGATAALLAGDALALPVLDYEHDGPDAFAAVYADLRDAFAATRSPVLPTGLNLGRQLFWQQQTFPDAFARTTRILTYPQYWSWRLSGVAASEVTSLGCHTDLWLPERETFSKLAHRCGWDRLFPPLAPAWERLGSILPEAAAATGLPVDCAVVNGIHDSNASLVRHFPGRHEPFTVVSTGTWTVLLAVGASVDVLDESRDMLANVDALGRPVACARFMGGREHATIAGGERASPPGLDDLAAVVARGVMALPSFAGRCGPFPGRAGCIIGDPPDDAGQRATLAALYCALVTDHCLDCLGARGDVIIEGSFAANALYGAILASLADGRRVLVSEDDTGTVLGCAALAHWREPPPTPALQPVRPLMLDGLGNYAERWREIARSGT